MQPDVRVDSDCLAGKFLEVTWLVNGFEEGQEPGDAHGILVCLDTTEHWLAFTIHYRSRALSWRLERRVEGNAIVVGARQTVLDKITK